MSSQTTKLCIPASMTRNLGFSTEKDNQLSKHTDNQPFCEWCQNVLKMETKGNINPRIMGFPKTKQVATGHN